MSPSTLGHCVPNDRLTSSHDSFFLTCVEKTLELGPLWFHFGNIQRRGREDLSKCLDEGIHLVITKVFFVNKGCWPRFQVGD